MTKASIYLQGGLGNQLFQIAFIYSYGRKNNIQIGYHKGEYVNPHSSIDYGKSVFPSINRLNVANLFHEPADKCISYIDNIPMNLKDCMFIGYFQCEKYFKEYKQDIYTLFHFPSIPISINEKSIFLHVRRGDYVNNPIIKKVHHLDLDSYYIKAISFIQSIKNIESIYIISNDILYCKKNDFFKNLPNVFFVENLNELETMSLMTKCSLGGICSNSSFSWWGSYLNRSPDKTIIFPSVWFNDKVHQNYPNDIYFEGSYVMDIHNFQIRKV